MHAAVATVLGRLPEITRYRGEMSKLPGLDQDKIDGLEEYAQAAAEAHSRWITSARQPEDIVALHAKGRAMRALLRSDARALAQRGLLSRAQVAAFRGHVGYENVAFDLIDWANLLRDHWSSVHGKTPLTEEDVRQAKALGEQMIRAVGRRAQAPVLERAAARIRHQALTLLIRAYNETRRALAYLRRNQGDVDRIAPSLYAGRTRKAEGEKPTLPSTAA